MNKASLTLTTHEADIDVARATVEQAQAAFDLSGVPARAPLELRRLANAFGADPQWVAEVKIPDIATASSLDALIDQYAALARCFREHLGWRRVIISVSWPGHSGSGMARGRFAMVFDPEEL
jgi:hypothetical protein